MTNTRGVLAVTTAAVAWWLVPGEALAAQPVSSTFTEVDSSTFATCDGFDVIETVEVHGRDTVYLDRDGHALRHVIRLRITGTFSNSETGEVISPDHAAFMIDEGLYNEDAVREGPRPGTYRIIGLEFQIKVEGRVVALQAGQLFVHIHDHDDPFDDEVLIDAGRRDIDSGFDICTALA